VLPFHVISGCTYDTPAAIWCSLKRPAVRGSKIQELELDLMGYGMSESHAISELGNHVRSSAMLPVFSWDALTAAVNCSALYSRSILCYLRA
jgi:hypothetical protein